MPAGSETLLMQDYRKVAPTFWTGRTGRAIRAAGPEVQVVAMYLLTCPSATWIGVYYIPLPTLCHETGLPLEVASGALARLSEAGFAHYDTATEYVWIPEMARHQIAERLDPKDFRIKAVVKNLQQMRKGPFTRDFYLKYREAYNLPDMPEIVDPSPTGAPSLPPPSQETKILQEQERREVRGEQNLLPAPAVAGSARRVKAVKGGTNGSEAPTAPAWAAYAAAYEARYKVAPVRNLKINGQLANFIKRIPAEEGPAVAAHYVQSNQALYVRAGHPVDLLLRDAEKLRTEWMTGRRVTEAGARELDQRAESAGVWNRMLRKAEAAGGHA